jgi:hypothetical protein
LRPKRGDEGECLIIDNRTLVIDLNLWLSVDSIKLKSILSAHLNVRRGKAKKEKREALDSLMALLRELG